MLEYNSLKVEARKASDRLIVFPIVCSEYYFIKSLVTYTDILCNHSDIQICLNRGDYTQSEIYRNSWDSVTRTNKCKNFEKFCKFLHVHTCNLCKFGSVRLHLRQHITECGRCHFVT